MLGDSIRRRRPARPRPHKKERKGGDTPRKGGGRGAAPGGGWTDRVPGWLGWLGVAVVVLLVSFGAGYLVATRVVFPPPATAGAGVPVPQLYGLDLATAELRLRDMGLRVGSVMEIASSRTAAGRVIAQEPVAEQQLRRGAAVSLAVSAGPPSVRIPPVTGLGAGTARDLFEAAGFDVQVQTVRGPGPRNAVARTEPAAGTVVRLPAVVTLMINVGPEEPEVVEPVDSPAPPPVDPIWP
jgi:beta-lactam-binding protein with PASTA domain